jgi:hypothetical protein
LTATEPSLLPRRRFDDKLFRFDCRFPPNHPTGHVNFVTFNHNFSMSANFKKTKTEQRKQQQADNDWEAKAERDK